MTAILYRKSIMDAEERSAAERYFELADTVVGLRSRVVVARYRALPFYGELVRDLGVQGSRLINSQREHDYIAGFEWYHDLFEITPRTWFRLQDVPKSGGPFVVKGSVNSKKEQWDSQMYAPTYLDAVRITRELQMDHYIGVQPVLVREYVPLKTYEIGLNGLPFTNEWRCFFLRGELLASGYYWSGATEHTKLRAALTDEGIARAQEAATRIASSAPFTAIDVAETADGRWLVIEINDGQMAGLSDVDPDALYRRLAAACTRENV